MDPSSTIYTVGLILLFHVISLCKSFLSHIAAAAATASVAVAQQIGLAMAQLGHWFGELLVAVYSA